MSGVVRPQVKRYEGKLVQDYKGKVSIIKVGTWVEWEDVKEDCETIKSILSENVRLKDKVENLKHEMHKDKAEPMLPPEDMELLQKNLKDEKFMKVFHDLLNGEDKADRSCFSKACEGIQHLQSSEQEKSCAKLFSGENSREMWDEINSSKTVDDLKWALYGVCCKLQNFETKVNKISNISACTNTQRM